MVDLFVLFRYIGIDILLYIVYIIPIGYDLIVLPVLQIDSTK